MPAASMLRHRPHFHVSRSVDICICLSRASIACILLAISLPVKCGELTAAACAAAGTDTQRPESSSFTFRITPSIFDVDLRPCHACVRIALHPLALSRVCDNVLFSDTQTGIRGKRRHSDRAAKPCSNSPSSPSPASSFCTASPATSTTRCARQPATAAVARHSDCCDELWLASCFACCLESDPCLAFTTLQLLSHLAAQLPPGSTVVDIGAAPRSRRVA